VRETLLAIEGVDLVCRLETPAGEPFVRDDPGPPPPGSVAVVERGEARLCFRPGGEVRDRRGAGWHLEGDLAAVEAAVEGGCLGSDAYPDPLARVWAALAAPNAGEFILSLAPGYEAVDWGGVTHAGGGSHGSLHAGDSLGPLLFVNCGPEQASARKQWTLADIAPIVLDHFGLS
jgi:hypothetical protein